MSIRSGNDSLSVRRNLIPMINTIRPSIAKGLYLVPGSDIELLLSTLETQQINFMFAVPPIFQRLTTRPRWPKIDIRAIQHVSVAAARCPTEVQLAITDRMIEGAFCQQ